LSGGKAKDGEGGGKGSGLFYPGSGVSGIGIMEHRCSTITESQSFFAFSFGCSTITESQSFFAFSFGFILLSAMVAALASIALNCHGNLDGYRNGRRSNLLSSGLYDSA